MFGNEWRITLYLALVWKYVIISYIEGANINYIWIVKLFVGFSDEKSEWLYFVRIDVDGEANGVKDVIPDAITWAIGILTVCFRVPVG